MPMKGRHETVGVLFLDTQSTLKQVVSRGPETGKFTEDHLTWPSPSPTRRPWRSRRPATTRRW